MKDNRSNSLFVLENIGGRISLAEESRRRGARLKRRRPRATPSSLIPPAIHHTPPPLLLFLCPSTGFNSSFARSSARVTQMESLRNRPRFFVKISSLLRPRFPHNFFHGRKSEISAQSARLKTRVGSYFVSFFLFFQPNTIRSIRTQFEKRKKKVGGETTTKNEKLLSSNSRYTFVAW